MRPSAADHPQRTSDQCDAQVTEGPVVGYEPNFPTPRPTLSTSRAPVDAEAETRPTAGLVALRVSGRPLDPLGPFDTSTVFSWANHSLQQVEPSTQLKEMDDVDSAGELDDQAGKLKSRAHPTTG